MEENEKIVLFEKAAIPSAVAKLSVPMIFSSLVMVLYNMAIPISWNASTIRCRMPRFP